MKKWIYSGIRQELPSEREVTSWKACKKSSGRGNCLAEK